MPLLLKRKLFIQAQECLGNVTYIVGEHELPSGAYSTYVTVKEVELETEIEPITIERFNELKQQSIEDRKAEIMKRAEEEIKQLDASI